MQANVDQILVYGSRAKGCHDGSSDWDILIVSNKAESFEHRRVSKEGFSLDITYGGLAAISQQFLRQVRDNNNWLLNACVEGRPLGYPTERVQALLEHAQILYDEGPRELSSLELIDLRRELASRWSNLAISRRRGHTSQADWLLFRIAADQLALRLLYLRYVLDRRWTISARHLLRRCEKDYPALFAKLVGFKLPFEAKDQVACLESILTAFLEEIDTKTVNGGS